MVHMHDEAWRTLPSDRNTSLCSVVLSLLPVVLVLHVVLNMPPFRPGFAYFSEMPM